MKPVKVAVLYQRLRCSALYLVALAAVTVLLMQFAGEAADSAAFRISTLLKCLADAVIILSPCALAGRKTSGVYALVAVWGTFLTVMANVWYARFWGDFIPPSAVSMAGNVDALLLNSIAGLWRAGDIISLVCAVVPTAVFVCQPPWKKAPDIYRSGVKRRISLFVTSVAIFVAGQALYTRSEIKWRQTVKLETLPFLQTTSQRITGFIPKYKLYLRSNGLPVYCVRFVADIADYLKSTRPLTQRQLDDLTADLAAWPSYIPDSTFRCNRDKNVIIIIAESLNSYIIGVEAGGHKVTPTLDSLMSLPTTFSNINIATQIRDGGSGDGQLIVNTGLHPLQHGSAAILYGSRNEFPSLVRTLAPASSAVIFADKGTSWNEAETFRHYGFEDIYTVNDFSADAARNGADAAMFSHAVRTIPSLRRPYLLEMVTISMHVPFIDDGVEMPQWIKDLKTDENNRNYINVTHYFDTSLRVFIESLRAAGQLDDTLLFITADHSQNLALDNAAASSDEAVIPIPFIAVGAGKGGMIDKVSGQIDIFPTILEISGRWDTAAYHGLGFSMLNAEATSAIRRDGTVAGDAASPLHKYRIKALGMSRDIMVSDYFNGKNMRLTR